VKVGEAKDLVLDLIEADLRRSGAPVPVESTSPDPSDPGKFAIDGKAAGTLAATEGAQATG